MFTPTTGFLQPLLPQGHYISAMESEEKGDLSARQTSSSQSQHSSPSMRSRPHSEEGQSSTSPEMPSSSTSKTVKASKMKVCRVCGDKAKSFHFGGLSCDSCKAFFRRSVQHEAYMNFQCAYDSSCSINMSTRKSCQKCRFDKCLTIGMEKNWVMTDDERNALSQQRMERKQQAEGPTTATEEIQAPRSIETETSAGENGDYIPDVTQMLKYMKVEDQDCIKEVVEFYRKSYLEIPYRVPKSTDGPRNSLQIVDMFTTILRRFAYFSKLIPEFAELSRDDQGNLLRASVLEMCLLRGALSFDSENHRWPNTNLELLKHCPQLKVEDMEKLVSRELYELHMNFIHRMQMMKVDEPTVMLLLLVVLFYPERSVVQDVVKVNQAQEKYLILLEKYVAWRYGPKHGPKLYPHLLTKLTDLRQLNDLHTEYNLKLDKSEVEIIREGLGELELNPYPQWNIVQVPGSGRTGMDESLATIGSPEFPPQPVESQSPPVSYTTRRSNPMTEAFLKRIPALIDDPFASLISESEMQQAGARFAAAMAGRDTSIVQFNIPTSGEFSPGVPPGGHGLSYRSPKQQSPTSDNPISGVRTSQSFEPFVMTSNEIMYPRPSGLESFGLNPQSDLFRQISGSLSPEMRAQLGALSANDGGGIDLSKIPPELISSYFGGSIGGGQQRGSGTEDGLSSDKSESLAPAGWQSSGGTTGNSSSSSGDQCPSHTTRLTGRMSTSEDCTWN